MDKKLEKIIDLKLDASDRDAERHGLIQYNYGQILRIHGLDLPPAVEIQFSYREKGGTTENRIGTTKDGITEVQIPDKMLKNNGTTQDYAIWVFVYVTDETSGNTVYRIKLYVDSRPAPGEIGEDPEEKRILDEAVEMVNQAADRAEAAERGASDQAAAAEQSKTDAAESAETAKKYLAETEEVKEETVKELTELSESVKTVIADGEESIAEKQTLAEKSITDHTDTEIARLDQETQASEERLTETIRTANNTAEAVENTASEARRAKESLDASVQNATEEKEAVAAATRTANTAKKNLDQSTADANVAKTALDKTIQSADDQNTSLGEKIETSKQLKTDLQTAGEKATQDIQTAGSEQLGKMQAVAEEFTADREQIATNKEDIGSLKKDISTKITKFYASNQGETHITDSDNGKIQDMVLYGKSEQKQYKGINLFSPDTNYAEYIEVSIPKGSSIFWATDGSPAPGGNFRFFNEDKTENMWFGIDKGTTSKVLPLSINAKYVQNLIATDFDLSKICLGIGKKPIYEPYTGGIPSPSPDYPQEIKSVVNPTVKVSNEDGTKSQTVTLPYTLNTIPVSSGGNVTINGQQYIADYVDVERGKLVKKLKSFTMADMKKGIYTWGVNANIDNITGFFFYYLKREDNYLTKSDNAVMMSTILRHSDNVWGGNSVGCAVNVQDDYMMFGVPTYVLEDSSSDENACASFMKICENTNAICLYSMASPIENDLTPEEIEAFKALITNYPVTKISVKSDQLDGYTVFNYPISMANGWNYVKQQLNDNRDYIYDMDIQSAEAYVNSEYAVALTELEV